MTDEVADLPDPTGILPVARPGLADLLAGEPRLPLAFLVVLTGPARGTALVVTSVPCVVGRSSEADLVIADDAVSRRHAEIRIEDDSLVLEDLGSSNGTSINGNAMVGALSLLDGDLVTFGSATALVKRVG